MHVSIKLKGYLFDYIDFYVVSCFLFGFIYNLCIDLCYLQIFMTKHFTYSVNVGATCQLQCGEGMAEAVKCDFLVYAC